MLLSPPPAILLMLSMIAAASDQAPAVHVGKLRAVSPDHIELDRRDGSILSVGFFGEADVLATLTAVRTGDEVRAVFGAETPPGGTRPINKLLSIRRCAKVDPECAADRKAEEAEQKRTGKVYAEIRERAAECRRAMGESLKSDSRHVSARKSGEPLSKEILAKLNSLTGRDRICADNIIKGDQAALFEACEIHHCGDNVGGGCYHIAGFVSDAAIERAVMVCSN